MAIKWKVCVENMWLIREIHPLLKNPSWKRIYEAFPRDKIIFIANNNKYITVYKARRSHRTIRTFKNVSNVFSELPHISAGRGDYQDDLFWKSVYNCKIFNILEITTITNSKNYSRANQSKNEMITWQ